MKQMKKKSKQSSRKFLQRNTKSHKEIEDQITSCEKYRTGKCNKWNLKNPMDGLNNAIERIRKGSVNF